MGAGKYPFFFFLVGTAFGLADVFEPLDKLLDGVFLSACPPTILTPSGCSTASETKVAPKIVSGRVVNILSAPSCPTNGKSISAPIDLPIQLRCMVSTLSGQPES